MDTRKMVLAGLMAALALVGTMVIQIPVAAGYVHLGDSIVYLCGILLGPFLGGVAAATGSMLADLMSGYGQYAVPTFIIKGIDAVVVGFIYMHILKSQTSLLGKSVRYVIAFIPGAVIMVLGYGVTEYLFAGIGGAMSTILPNIMQAFLGGALGLPLYVALEKANVERLIQGHNN